MNAVKVKNGFPQLFADLTGRPLPFDISQLEAPLQDALTGTIVLRGGSITEGGDGLAPNFVLVEPSAYKLKQQARIGGTLAHQAANVVLDWTWVEACINHGRFLGATDQWGGLLIANRATYWKESAELQAQADAEFAASFTKPSALLWSSTGPDRGQQPVLPVPTTPATTQPPDPQPVAQLVRAPDSFMSTDTSPTLRANSPQDITVENSRRSPASSEDDRAGDGQSPEASTSTSPSISKPSSSAKRRRSSSPDSQPRRRVRLTPQDEEEKTPVPENSIDEPLAGPSNDNESNLPPPPRPPTKVVQSSWFGHDFTDEDRRYLKEYIDYICQRQYDPDFKAMFKDMASKAPQHNASAWARYFYKNERILAEEIPSLQRLYESSSSDEDEGSRNGSKKGKAAVKGVTQSVRHSSPKSKQPWKTQKIKTMSGSSANEYAITDEERRALVLWMAEAPVGVPEAELLQNFARIHTRYSWRTWQTIIKNHKESFDRAIARKRAMNMENSHPAKTLDS